MNAYEFMERLEHVDPEAELSFVIYRDGEFVRYVVDSVADDGTLVAIEQGILDLQ